MKRIAFYILFLTIALITNSCEENGIFLPPSDDVVFEVKIDGELFSTSEVSFVNDDNIIVITAIDSNSSEIFTLNVEDFEIGTYSLEGVNNFANYIQNDPTSADIWSTYGETSSRGTIEFTDIDFTKNTVSGRFNFIGTNLSTGSKRAFAEGVFTNIPLSAQPVSQDSFTAKVDGVLFEYISLFATPITIGNTNLISISANKSSYNTINFNLNADITPGEYDLGSFITQSYPTGQYTTSITDIYVADGKITIISHDTSAKKIVGTFSFEAKDILSSAVAHSITDGSFSVSY